MPSDIRSFFGGKPFAESQQKEPLGKQPAAKKSRSARKVLDDSDDEGPKKASPKKQAPKKRDPSPEEEQTNASEYFGKSKPKKSAPVRASTTEKKASASTPKPSPAKSTPKASNKTTVSNDTTPNGRTSARKRKSVNYNEIDQSNEIKLDDDDDDMFTAKSISTRNGLGDDYKGDDAEIGETNLKPRRLTTGKSRQSRIVEDEGDFAPEEDIHMDDVQPNDDFVMPDKDEAIKIDKPVSSKKGSANAGRKRKSHELDEEEDDEGEVAPKKIKPTKTTTPKKAPAKKKEKAADVPESAEMKAIFDSIPLVRPPTPPPRDGETKKFKPGTVHVNSGPPPGAGSKEVPTGEENCLAGLSFVFTGLLDTLAREDGQALVKRYGGKVMSGPSPKTTYVVLGKDAGPAKLGVIAAHKLKTINEDGLFELIRRLPANGGDSKAAAKQEEKVQAEIKKIEQMAAEVEKEEKKAAAASGAGIAQGRSGRQDSASSAPDTRLWTVKYAPTQIGQICGNKQPVEKLQRWLRSFQKNMERDFKLAGPDGSGIYRAVIISGPPGIGKTTAAHLVAKLEGYDVVESNASDTRSKKLVEAGLKGVLDTTSLLGYFAGDFKNVERSKKRLCLIMDEVDGMSAGDRGGVGALATVCKKSKVPLILICNERKLPKLKPFDYCTFALPFRRPTTDQIRSRIMTIGFREGIKLPPNILNALIEGTGADIRQVVNMLSTAKIDQDINEQAMDFDGSKNMSKAWQKHAILKPWDIVGKILGSEMFSPASKSSLNDKIELYFNDHDMSPLFLQENYLGTNPLRSQQYSGREKALKHLELVEQAANSISEGDMVDRMIHGQEQQWSLMPTHAIFSFVRPASFVAGGLGYSSTGFPSWFGKNSTQGRLLRAIREIQGHMRMRTSGDRHEVRQQYLPVLWSSLIKKLEIEGKDKVPDVIELMDSYFLTKDDWDAILELGVGPMDQERVKLDSQTKATFTRMYNSQSHPLPFMKATNVVTSKRMPKEKPDLEEAIDESEDEEVVGDIKEEDDDDGADGDVMKDKYVKAPKKKKAAKAADTQKAAGKGKRKSKSAVDEDDELGNEEEEEEEEEEDVKPKKGKAKAAAKAKGKGKK